VEGAFLAAQHASEVRLIYRGPELVRPAAVLLDRLAAQPSIEILLNTEVMELVGGEAGLRAVRVAGPGGDQRVIDVDGLFVEIGADPRTAIAETLGVDLNPETREIHVDRMMRTNVEGIFAAGDITDGSGPLKQTVTAAAQGAVAALSATCTSPKTAGAASSTNAGSPSPQPPDDWDSARIAVIPPRAAQGPGE